MSSHKSFSVTRRYGFVYLCMTAVEVGLVGQIVEPDVGWKYQHLSRLTISGRSRYFHVNESGQYCDIFRINYYQTELISLLYQAPRALSLTVDALTRLKLEKLGPNSQVTNPTPTLALFDNISYYKCIDNLLRYRKMAEHIRETKTIKTIIAKFA